tara:strand:+ start:6550 stop:6837 length:288 start_codon:yes stop_codon:yes gene_type:complete
MFLYRIIDSNVRFRFHAICLSIADEGQPSFWLTSHLGSQIVVIAACMALTSVKVIIVFRRFMEADHLTPPLKIFTYAWTIGCAAMIVGVAWLTTS